MEWQGEIWIYILSRLTGVGGGGREGEGRHNYWRAGFFPRRLFPPLPFPWWQDALQGHLPLTAVTDARTRFQHARPLKRRSSVRPGRGEKHCECELAQSGGNVQGHARAHIKGPDGFKLWTHKHAPVSHRRLDCERKKKKEEEKLSVGRCRRELRLEQEIENSLAPRGRTCPKPLTVMRVDATVTGCRRSRGGGGASSVRCCERFSRFSSLF